MAAAVSDQPGRDGNPLYQVWGIELDNEAGREKTRLINNGEFPFACEDESLEAAFRNAVKRGNLTASTDTRRYSDADIIIVDVNLDLISGPQGQTVSWETFKEAILAFGREIAENTLVIVETTVPPGTCEKVVLPILRDCFTKRGLDADKVMLAHSYERVMPGKHYLSSIKNFWRVYSACSPEAEAMCREFLTTIINVEEYPLVCLASPRASETAKILENSYRATNIAFMEEWSDYAQQIGIDLFEVIEAIKNRPTHSNMMFPGFGVGGYCLTKDPLFGSISANELFGVPEPQFPFSEMAVKTNKTMPGNTVRLLKEMLGEYTGKNILLLGVSYRQDVGDTRFSPSEVFVKELESQKANVDFHDPYVSYWPELRAEVPGTVPDMTRYDAVVLAVAHHEYKTIPFALLLKGKATCLLDANNVLTYEQKKDLEASGVKFRSIGRG